MPDSRLLITCPMLPARRRVVVDPGASPMRVIRTEWELTSGPLEVARAARMAGASVTWMSPVEPGLEDQVRAVLEDAGVVCDLLPMPAASFVDTTYVDGDGAERFAVREARVPSVQEVDRVLDRAEHHLRAGVSFVVAAGDLIGVPRLDFMERLVGRAWGYGVKTICVEGGKALKQAFHTQPLAALLDAEELLSVSPPDEPDAKETEEETLRRIFLDPVRLLLLRRACGDLVAATRGETRTLQDIAAVDPVALMGATAARLLVTGDDHLRAVDEALGILRAERTPDAVPGGA